MGFLAEMVLTRRDDEEEEATGKAGAEARGRVVVVVVAAADPPMFLVPSCFALGTQVLPGFFLCHARHPVRVSCPPLPVSSMNTLPHSHQQTPNSLASSCVQGESLCESLMWSRGDLYGSLKGGHLGHFQ